jgi:hypothetical protein
MTGEDSRGFGIAGALAAGIGEARHGKPKRLVSPRRACHWSSPTTAISSTVMSPARAVQTRAGMPPDQRAEV